MIGKTNSQLSGGYPDNYFKFNKYYSGTSLFRAFSTYILPEEFTIDITDAQPASINGNQMLWTGGNNNGLKVLHMIGDMSKFNNLVEWVNGHSNLVTITGDLDFSGTSGGNIFPWNQYLNLKNITIKENGITTSCRMNLSALTNESINSILNGLKDLTGETAQTISLNSTVVNNLTAKQIAIATNKNWTIAGI